jgi:protein required for attachment to host cells
MILVVTANTNNCRIYHYNKHHDNHPAQLTLLSELNHPESKLRNGALTSDRSGHYQASSVSGRGAYSPHTEAKENEIDIFSREIAQLLNKERNAKEYDKLILIAPSHMFGLLNQHLDKHVKELITNHIQKDLQHLKDHELLEFLKENAKYQD